MQVSVGRRAAPARAPAGLPAVGKSTLALGVGRLLGRPVLDKDVVNAATVGRTDEPDSLAYGLLFGQPSTCSVRG
jgi:predicted kinase